MGKILALDFGLKHIGVAMSDEQQNFAFAREKISNETGVFEAIAKLISEEKVVKIVMSKSTSKEVAEACEIFTEKLQEQISIPVVFVDEIFTTKLALKIPHTLGMKKNKRQNFDDHSAAAAYLLESYLQSQKP